MTTAATTIGEGVRPGTGLGSSSAVSWPAIFAGAAAAAALSLILLVLGIGLGLSVVSPWGSTNRATTISWLTIIWTALTAFASSGLGGYLAGRLRVRWIQVHTDEVYFRDTAHGFLAWAVATLATAAVLTSATSTILNVGMPAAAVVAASGNTQKMAQGEDSMASMYTMDSLFRIPSDGESSNADESTRTRSEAARIFAHSMHAGSLSPEDTRYTGQLVAQRTGMSQQAAEARVTNAYNEARNELQAAEARAKKAADQVRKDAAYASLWIFVSLLIGAFSASLMATIGGRRRDLF